MEQRIKQKLAGTAASKGTDKNRLVKGFFNIAKPSAKSPESQDLEDLKMADNYKEEIEES